MDEDEYKLLFEQFVSDAQLRKRVDLTNMLMHEWVEPAARERLERVRIVKPAIAYELERRICDAIQMGQIKKIITDAQMKAILSDIAELKAMRYNINEFDRLKKKAKDRMRKA